MVDLVVKLLVSLAGPGVITATVIGIGLAFARYLYRRGNAKRDFLIQEDRKAREVADAINRDVNRMAVDALRKELSKWGK